MDLPAYIEGWKPCFRGDMMGHGGKSGSGALSGVC